MLSDRTLSVCALIIKHKIRSKPGGQPAASLRCGLNHELCMVGSSSVARKNKPHLLNK